MLWSCARLPDVSDKVYDPPRNWLEAGMECAPVLLGVATGILVGDLMHRRARRPVAVTLAMVGVAAVAPTVIDAVRDKVAGPNTRRGTQRTLRSIREGVGAPARDISYVKEELGELYVG